MPAVVPASSTAARTRQSVLPLPPSPTGTSAPRRREGSSPVPRAPRYSAARRGRLPTESRAGWTVLPRLESHGWGAGARPGEGGTRPRLLRSGHTRKVVPNLGGAELCAAPTPGTCILKHLGKGAPPRLSGSTDRSLLAKTCHAEAGWGAPTVCHFTPQVVRVDSAVFDRK